ncbi:MAG: DUF2891 domain-containing protein [Streptosporangiaceae bacterium]
MPSALQTQWLDRLRPEVAGYAAQALDNIGREFPSYLTVLLTGPGEFPARPRDRTPVFYGSLDWHSCVEMHWLLVRLLKVAGDAVPADQIRAVLDRQLTEDGLRAEAEFMRTKGGFERPYGWGWALKLAYELTTWPGDPDAPRWAAAIEPLASVLTESFLGWLPKAIYPVRSGLHANGSFGLSLALPYARHLAASGYPSLAKAIKATACRWYAADAGYPAAWEPSGHDFLSPALAEAELMTCLLPPDEFAPWLTAFLPDLADGSPASLFTPAVVSDSSDGQIAHLHGLNLSRAWCFRRLAETLPPGDPHVPVCTEASRRHAEASLPHVTSDDYMVTHWLAAYAVLLFS